MSGLDWRHASYPRFPGTVRRPWAAISDAFADATRVVDKAEKSAFCLLKFGRGGGGIEPTSEPWGLLNIPTSLPRGQTNLHPELAFSTVPDNYSRKENSPPACLCRTLRLGTRRFGAQQHNRSLFPTHNPTHRMRCLVRLARSLAVPACLVSCCKSQKR